MMYYMFFKNKIVWNDYLEKLKKIYQKKTKL